MVAVRMAPSGAPGLDAYRSTNLRTAASLSFSREMVAAQLKEAPMFKPTPNPPDTDPISPYESPDSNKLNEAAERALDHHFPPTEPKPPKRNGQLFSVCPGINTEALLANASEDLLSISAIAADLADDVDGSRRSVALALSRMADGVHLLVERALDHLDEPEMAAIFAKQQLRVD